MKVHATLLAAAACGVMAGPARANQPVDWYLVFFDSGSDRRAANVDIILHNFVLYRHSVSQGGEGDVQIFGAADRVGSDAYNLHLSCRRARAVRNYLVRSGVPSHRIRLWGFGESNPIRDTADGVAAQNRYVMLRVIRWGSRDPTEREWSLASPCPEKP
jgi:hypothetical protein